MKILDNLTSMQKGILFVVSGLLIVLDAFKILSNTIHYVFALFGLGLIFYGISLTKIFEGWGKK